MPTGDLHIPASKNGYTVVSIAPHAFAGCTGLTSVTIPNTVTSIGGNHFDGYDGAFAGCTGLKSVEIPNSVTLIGFYAFYGCTSLTSVTIPNSVTSFDGAFQRCTGLTSVTIPNSITSIGSSAFENCTGLTSVSIPESVTAIGERAFLNCTSLASVTIPESVTVIGRFAFFGCSDLTSVSIPASVTNLGDGTFYECPNLKTIYYDTDSPVKAPSDLFSTESYSQSTLYTTCAPEMLMRFEPWKYFENIKSMDANYTLKYSFDDATKTCSVIGYEGTTPEYTIDIPAEVDGYTVTSVGNNAFYGCSKITFVNIAETVTSIGANAFGGCTRLHTPTLPASLTTIGENAFRNCVTLATITIPAAVTSIGRMAFYGCMGLETVRYDTENPITAPADVFSSDIYSNAVLWTDAPFEKLSQMLPWSLFRHTDMISNPDMFTYSYDDDANTCTITGYDLGVEYDEAYGYDKIKRPEGDLVIPAKKDNYTVTSIGEKAFYQCSGLTSVSLPETVTSLGLWAFRSCRNISKVEYASMESFFRMDGKSAFEEGYNLYIAGNEVTEITIPDTFTQVANCMFYNCSGLTSVKIPNSVTSISGSSFYGCSGLTELTIPTSVTSLGNYVLQSCSKLKHVTIPESVTQMGTHTLYQCRSLESFTLPESCTTITYCMFRFCNALKEIIIPNTVKQIDDLAFSAKESGGFMSATYVSIPGSIEKFGKSIFQGSPDITTVVYDTDSPIEAPANIFDEEIYSQATLYTDCPAVKLAGVSPWNKFLSVKPMNELPDFSGIEVMPEDADMPVEI
ncbi:MAG: leucine-rich repeat domain-containing protein, partial [Duncaniella sp.]|nr:leucine-rich repeat domain-containing protein [Duncaniella sp.]